MINSETELDRLRQTLLVKGLDEEVVFEIVQQAATEIHSALIDIAYDALVEVEQLAITSKSSKFATDIQLNISPNDISIDTASGRHDFSEPARQMLPSLLKSPKIAKDGSLYKRIPMKVKSISPGGLIEAHRALNEINAAKRAALKDQAARSGELPTTQVSAGLDMAHFQGNRKNSQTTEIKFKTASSKQSPDVNWVQPAKDLDFGLTLHNANSDIDSRVALTVADIISKYEGVA